MATEKPSHDTLPVSTSKDGTLIATCHCGRVQVQMPSKPAKLNECHCSVCYKYGALWGYFPRNDVVVTTAGDTKLQAYVRDDKGSDGHLSFNRCGYCGCMMLWWGEGEYAGPEHKMGVNCRMLPKHDIEGIERRVSKGP